MKIREWVCRYWLEVVTVVIYVIFLTIMSWGWFTLLTTDFCDGNCTVQR